MFVKFSCGCIGFPLPTPIDFNGQDRNAIVIDPCDGDRDAPYGSLSWSPRQMESGVTHVPLEGWDADLLHKRLGIRLAKADSFDRIKTELGLPT